VAEDTGPVALHVGDAGNDAVLRVNESDPLSHPLVPVAAGLGRNPGANNIWQVEDNSLHNSPPLSKAKSVADQETIAVEEVKRKRRAAQYPGWAATVSQFART
jgi:hypothetical protein